MAKKKATTRSKALTPKQALFCKEYIIDMNGTQAYIRTYATQNESTARVQASKLLTKANIKQKINKLKKDREEKLDVSAEWVLQEAIEIYKMAKGDIEQKVSYRAKGGKAQEIKMKKTNLREATKALELIGKHVSVKAFEKVIDLGDDVTFTIKLPEELKENT